MLSNLDTAWRYPLALLLGLLTGLYIGGMLATIYVGSVAGGGRIVS